MPFAATWMDLETVTLSEINLTEKGKFSVISDGESKTKLHKTK